MGTSASFVCECVGARVGRGSHFCCRWTKATRTSCTFYVVPSFFGCQFLLRMPNSTATRWRKGRRRHAPARPRFFVFLSFFSQQEIFGGIIWIKNYVNLLTSSTMSFLTPEKTCWFHTWIIKIFIPSTPEVLIKIQTSTPEVRVIFTQINFKKYHLLPPKSNTLSLIEQKLNFTPKFKFYSSTPDYYFSTPEKFRGKSTPDLPLRNHTNYWPSAEIEFD